MSRFPFGPQVTEAPRRTIAGADCWLSADGRHIVAARTLSEPILRWRAEA